MRTRFTALLGAVLLATLAGSAAAQDLFSSRTRHYQFLPRFSVLNQSGGFGGFNLDFHVEGTFDFITTPSPLDVYPPVILADFDNVAATGKLGPTGYEIDLDEAIKLSGLEGASPLGGPTNVFRFRGETSDGSSVKLWAATHGPWIYLRGHTTPPPGSADFFEYRLKALAHEQPFADVNDDGVVDGADLAAAGPLSTNFLIWQQQFGVAPPPEADFEAAIAAASASAAATPEPGALSLALAVLGITTCRARLRGRRLPRPAELHLAPGH